MKYLIFIAGLVFFTATIATAQKSGYSLKGQLTDSLQKQQVNDATVSLVNAKDPYLRSPQHAAIWGESLPAKPTTGTFPVSGD